MRRSLLTKLLVLFMSFATLPVAATVILLLMITNQGFASLLNDNHVSVKRTVQAKIDQVASELLTLSEHYGQNEALTRAFATGSRETLGNEALPVYERLALEHKLEVFEFGGKDGIVFYRGHNPEKYGDSKSDKPSTRAALSGKAVAGFEFGSSGLAVRAFVPLREGGQVIGTLQTGVNDDFLKDLSATLSGVTMRLYDAEGKLAFSSNAEEKTTVFGDEASFDRILNGEELAVSTSTSEKSYIPMFDPTHGQVIGAIEIDQDTTIVNQANRNTLVAAAILAAITVIVAGVTSVFIGRNIVRAVQSAGRAMSELAEGDLSSDIDRGKRLDELGQLLESVARTQLGLRGMITEIREASSHVNTQSRTLLDTAEQVKSGSLSTSGTMQELAVGAESQATSASELAGLMNEFAVKLSEAAQGGARLTAESDAVLDVTGEGARQMEQSREQMSRISELVQQAVLQIHDLDDQTKQISSLVQTIHGIAAQTNMLALNASIEAARAGESGRGFAVVAGEVRKLAAQVADCAANITVLVDTMSSGSSRIKDSLGTGFEVVEAGSAQMMRTSDAFARIESAMANMAQQIKTISAHLGDISSTGASMSDAIENVAAVSEQSAAGVHETSAAVRQTTNSMEDIARSAGQLGEVAGQLDARTSRFKLK